MKAYEFEKSLVDWTIKNSGYDEHRDYIGLSSIYDCPHLIHQRFFNKTGVLAKLHFRTRYSYELEKIIIDRLKGIGIYSPRKEISLYGGLVKGHTDGEIDRNLLEIKTVPATDHIPNISQDISRKVYWQSQAYMYFGPYNLTFLLYFARESGIFRIFEIMPDSKIQDQIIIKLDRIVNAVRSRICPRCECGKCHERE